MQLIEQTDQEKLAMYMKLSKEELAKLLIESNKQLALSRITYTPYYYPTVHFYTNYPTINYPSGNIM